MSVGEIGACGESLPEDGRGSGSDKNDVQEQKQKI